MRDTIRVSEVFESLQGEGKYIGYPTLFIRLSGCTRNIETCPFECDTLYALDIKKGKDIKIEEIKKDIIQYSKNRVNYITITGGEPLLQIKNLRELIKRVREERCNIFFMLESNGDLIKDIEYIRDNLHHYFYYISISPKEREVAERVYNILKYYKSNIGEINYDIKVVTDLDNIGVDMIEYASELMPLTTFSIEKDKEIQRKVWEYCSKNKIRFSPRIQIDVWGKRKGI